MSFFSTISNFHKVIPKNDNGFRESIDRNMNWKKITITTYESIFHSSPFIVNGYLGTTTTGFNGVLDIGVTYNPEYLQRPAL